MLHITAYSQSYANIVLLSSQSTDYFCSFSNYSYFHLVTTASYSDIGFYLSSSISDGWYTIVRNMPSSLGNLVIADASSNVIVSLAPSVSTTMIYSSSTMDWYFL